MSQCGCFVGFWIANELLKNPTAYDTDIEIREMPRPTMTFIRKKQFCLVQLLQTILLNFLLAKKKKLQQQQKSH